MNTMIHPTKVDPERQYALSAVAELESARDARVRYDQLLDAAITAYGDGNGRLISGVYREHYPEPVKDQLRAYARRVSECTDRALGYWTRGRRRVETLRPLLEYYRRLPDGRVSYY